MSHNRLLFAFSLVFLSCQHAHAQNPYPGEPLAGAGYGVVGASLARAEEAICRSMVNYSHVRGAFGEAVMERVVLGSRSEGGWQTVSVSPKPQGIDGIYIKRDGLGNPRALLVGEAKFGSSRLIMTKDGRQLSSTWMPPRLSYEAIRYLDAGARAFVVLRARPNGLAENLDVLKVRLTDSQNGYFWRKSMPDPWAYDGPKGTLQSAQSAALRDGRYLKAASDGKISYRQRVFTIDVSRDTISVKMQDARPTSPGNVGLKEIGKVKIDAAARMSYIAETKSEIARQLMIKNPCLVEAEARMIAATATRKMQHIEAILRQQNRAYCLSILSDSGKAGAISAGLAGVMDVSVQMYTRGQVDWGQAGGMALLGAASAGAGATAHHLVVGAINNAIAHQYFVQTANAVGLPTGMAAANIIGQGAGGVAGSAIFALGMWLSGNMNDCDAARAFAAGAAGSAVGVTVGAGVLSGAIFYGTAGTGAAISSLSGAAANSAALAWLGGGTAASGGGGAALGTAMIGGVVVVTAVAVGVVIYWGYAKYDDSQANHRHQYNADYLIRNPAVLKDICRRQ